MKEIEKSTKTVIKKFLCEFKGFFGDIYKCNNDFYNLVLTNDFRRRFIYLILKRDNGSIPSYFEYLLGGMESYIYPHIEGLYNFPFSFYYNILPNEVRQFDEKGQYVRSYEFEDKIASLLIASLLQEINQTYAGDKDKLATLILASQLVSTNLEFGSMNFTQAKPGFFEFSNYVDNFHHQKKDNSLNELESIYFFGLLFNHNQACKSFNESGRLIPQKLTEAFKSLLKSYKEIQYGNYENQDQNNKIREFGSRYFQGLMVVVEKMLRGEHNGVLYLFDHILMILTNHGLIDAGNIEKFTVEEWKSFLLKALEYSDFFDFLAPSNKVREISGRYDERALLDHFKGRQKLTVSDLGFGALGASFYDLIKRLEENGILVEVNHIVDILDPKSLSDDPKNYSIERFKRGKDGVFSHEKYSNYPDNEFLAEKELQEIIQWRNDLRGKGVFLGQTDLTEKELTKMLDIKKSDLVTLRGTVACVGDLNKRWQMIRNALDFLKPDGGVLLVEGGMTLLGGQNVNSIAIELNENNPEAKARVVYVVFNRRKKGSEYFHYKAGEQVLVIDHTKEQEIGKDYIGVPFSNLFYLTRVTYQSIRAVS